MTTTTEARLLAAADLLRLGGEGVCQHRFWNVGKRILGDGVTCSPRAGWQHVHVAVADHSRLAYAEVLPTDRRGDALAFLDRALGWFGEQGITVETVMTDIQSGCALQMLAGPAGRSQDQRVRCLPAVVD